MRSELLAWMVVALATAALAVCGPWISHAELFGADVLRGAGAAAWAAFVVAAFAVAVGLGITNPRVLVKERAGAAIAALSWPIFYLLRTNWLNTDGHMLTPKFEADVPRLGAHLTHDEILELFLHSRVWHYTHAWWGWSVVFSYQVVSCTAGAVFVYVLLRIARRLAPSAPWLFIAGVVSGGFMQLFFGDVENYTVTAVLVAVYVLMACRFLAGEVNLLIPAVVLAVAACFHMEAAWLWPSALYLAFVSRQRDGNGREAGLSAAIAGAIVAFTFLYFHFHGLPLRRFFSSHGGYALRMNGVFAVGMPVHYYVEQLNLLLLLCPAAGMAVVLAIWRRFVGDAVTIFLGIAAGSLVLMQVVWKSQIGVLDDWNLYAIGGLLAGLFIWRALACAARTPAMRIAAAVVAAAGWLHTYAWIVMNHRAGS